MVEADNIYKQLLDHILEKGVESEDRTGVGTISVFGTRMEFKIGDYFPLLTSKRVPFKLVLSELLWFLQGGRNRNMNIHDLYNIHTNKIWDEWATDAGDLGPIYGTQWRSWLKYDNTKIDQIAEVIRSIKENPYSRRHIVSAWNPAEIDYMRLPPCHILFQFYVRNNKLSCQMYQRSVDSFLGLPFNIASYSLLTYMIAQVTGLGVDRFVWVGGDTHIYKNHIDQVNLLLSREPRPSPQLEIDSSVKSIDDFNMSHFKLINYKPHNTIKASIAV